MSVRVFVSLWLILCLDTRRAERHNTVFAQ